MKYFKTEICSFIVGHTKDKKKYALCFTPKTHTLLYIKEIKIKMKKINPIILFEKKHEKLIQ